MGFDKLKFIKNIERVLQQIPDCSEAKSSYSFWNTTRREYEYRSFMDLLNKGEWYNIQTYVLQLKTKAAARRNYQEIFKKPPPNSIQLCLSYIHTSDKDLNKLGFNHFVPAIWGYKLFSDDEVFIVSNSQSGNIREVPIRIVNSIKIDGNTVYP